MKKWIHGAIPALLIHCSIGTVYCWSIFSKEIADYIGFSKGAVEWAFSLAIFFLGMSAAFFGRLVERNIKMSSGISSLTFSLGLLGTSAFIYYGSLHSHSLISLIGIYLSYGVVMGIGLGTGYISPVKTLMLWFKQNKGLATGLAVAGFGLAKMIASPMMQYFMARMPLYKMFAVLSIIYLILMTIGHALLKKPEMIHETANIKTVPLSEQLKPLGSYIAIWLFFYINIACGLMIISQEKLLCAAVGWENYIGIIAVAAAIFNAGGRVICAKYTDSLKYKETIFYIVFIVEMGVCALASILISKFSVPAMMLILILTINFGYGAGFSCIPIILEDRYGMNSISTIHGLTLSAWAVAGLTGNQISNLLIKSCGPVQLIALAAGMYMIALYLLKQAYEVKND